MNILTSNAIKTRLLEPFIKDIYKENFNQAQTLFNLMSVPIDIIEANIPQTEIILSESVANPEMKQIQSTVIALCVYTSLYKKSINANTVLEAFNQCKFSDNLSNSEIMKHIAKELYLLNQSEIEPKDLLVDYIMNKQNKHLSTVVDLIHSLFNLIDVTSDDLDLTNLSNLERATRLITNNPISYFRIIILTPTLDNYLDGIRNNDKEVHLYNHFFDLGEQQFIDTNNKPIVIYHKSALNPDEDYLNQQRLIGLVGSSFKLATIDLTQNKEDDLPTINNKILKRRAVIDATNLQEVNSNVSTLATLNLQALESSTIFGSESSLNLSDNSLTFNSIQEFLTHCNQCDLTEQTFPAQPITTIDLDCLDKIVQTIINSPYIEPIFKDIDNFANNKVLVDVIVCSLVFISNSIVTHEILDAIYDTDTLSLIKSLHGNVENNNYISNLTRHNIQNLLTTLKSDLIEKIS